MVGVMGVWDTIMQHSRAANWIVVRRHCCPIREITIYDDIVGIRGKHNGNAREKKSAKDRAAGWAHESC